MSEYTLIQGEFPNISFNDKLNKRNKNTTLFALETYCINLSNYNINIINQYKNFLTWNSKFIKNEGIKIPKYLSNGFPMFDNYSRLTEFKKYEDKIDGVCLICRYRKSNEWEIGDITELRLIALKSIQGFIKHCYGKKPYGGNLYKGVIGNNTEETWPSSLSKLKKLNEYKFNICFENCYYELWSWDYITEKIFDCFKAKTVPIYYGCYNIEEHIPKKLFIDFRDFKFNYTELSQYLKNISKQQYIDMVEEAYLFEKKCRLGKIDVFKEVLRGIK